jgi:transmembrane sensor
MMKPPLSPGKLRELSQKWLQGTLTPEERQTLEDWYNQQPPGQIEWPARDQSELQERLFARIREKAFEETPVIRLKRRRLITWYAAAASLLVIATGGYFMLHKQQPKQQTAQLIKNDIAPGHDQATLTLSNGKKIVLTKGLNGQLAVQDKTVISVNKNNITYDANKSGDQVNFNTLSTAKGEQSPYPLVLADGTKVWLNAESSITFPTAFNQKDRTVKITGEAYFEVKHNDKHPFKVQTATQTIEDIGTTFDVNAYADEAATKTTLVEGSIKVNGKVLKPNEQTDGTRIKTVNTEIYTAWKNGRFHFEGEDIHTVMRQLTRWYNIDVNYQGAMTTDVFYAGISRNRNISAVLKLFENTKGVHFKVEGRRVTVIQ